MTERDSRLRNRRSSPIVEWPPPGVRPGDADKRAGPARSSGIFPLKGHRHERSSSDRPDARANRPPDPGRRNGAEGPRPGRRGQGGGRGLLQHLDDRLSGDHDRPLLCRSDHHLHLPAHRQCRRQRRGHRDRDAGRARLRARDRHHRAVELARRAVVRCLAEALQPARHRRHRHPPPDPPHPRRRRAQRRHRASPGWQVRRARPGQGGEGVARPRRHGPRQGRVLPPDLSLGREPVGARPRLRQARQSQVQGRRDRLRRQAQHPALPDRRRLRRDGGAGDRDHRRRAAPPARRRVPRQRPGRSRPRPANMPCR